MNTLEGKLPKIEILEISKDQIKFVLENTEVSIANTLRRIMLAEIPTMAIHYVYIIILFLGKCLRKHFKSSRRIYSS